MLKVMIAGDPFFVTHRELLVSLAARYAMPTIYSSRETPLAMLS